MTATHFQRKDAEIAKDNYLGLPRSSYGIAEFILHTIRLDFV
jgi:hypothetical protein